MGSLGNRARAFHPNVRLPARKADSRSLHVSNLSFVRTPASVLTEILRHMRIAQHARVVFEIFPELQPGTEGLAWHLSERLPWPEPLPLESTAPLIGVCIKSAMEWMNHRAAQPEASRRDVQTAYLAGLLFHTPEVVHLEVRDGERVWDPLKEAEDPLCMWLPRHPHAIIQVRELSPYEQRPPGPAIRMLLLRKIYPGGHWGRLDVEVGHVFRPPDHLIPPREQ